MRPASAADTALVLDPAAESAGHVPSIGAELERRHERRHQIIRRGLAAADMLAVLAAALLAGLAAGGDAEASELMLAVSLTLPLWLVVFKLYGLYERDAKRITHSSLDDIPRLFHAILVGALLFWGYTELIDVRQVSVGEAVVFGLGALAFAVALRAAVRRNLLKLLGSQNLLVAGDASTLAPLVSKLRHNPKYGLVPVGRLTPTQDGGAANRSFGADLDPVADCGSLARAVRRLDASRLVIDRPSFSAAEVLEMIETCRRLGVKVSILPGAVDALGPATEIDEVEGITVLGLNPPVLGRTSRWLKRTFDVVVAGVLLLVCAPFLPLVAAAIKLDSPGPVLFRQTRVGKADRRFRLLKLRTMVADAEQRRAELLAASRDPNWLLLDDDPRVTRVGRFLRATSIDEIPQLWNVIRGEMSLVGPRPLPEAEDARIGGWERTRLDLTPGITGLWQVLGRTSIPFAEMVKLDYVYVTNWSLWLDFKLLAQTLPTVLRREGAN